MANAGAADSCLAVCLIRQCGAQEALQSLCSLLPCPGPCGGAAVEVAGADTDPRLSRSHLPPNKLEPPARQHARLNLQRSYSILGLHSGAAHGVFCTAFCSDLVFISASFVRAALRWHPVCCCHTEQAYHVPASAPVCACLPACLSACQPASQPACLPTSSTFCGAPWSSSQT